MSKSIWIVIIVVILGLGYMVFMRAPQVSAPSLGTISPVAGPTVSVGPSPAPAPNPSPNPIPAPSPTPPPAKAPSPKPVSKTPPPQSTPTPTPPPAGGSTTLPVKEVTVQATEYAFNPSTITAAPGQKVKVTLSNNGIAPHDFVIDGVTTSSVITGSSQTVVEFSAPNQPGTYPIYCSVGAHRSLGMEGKLVVQ